MKHPFDYLPHLPPPTKKPKGNVWIMVWNKGGNLAKHEHTHVVTDGKPIELTEMNDIWD